VAARATDMPILAHAAAICSIFENQILSAEKLSVEKSANTPMYLNIGFDLGKKSWRVNTKNYKNPIKLEFSA